MPRSYRGESVAPPKPPRPPKHDRITRRRLKVLAGSAAASATLFGALALGFGRDAEAIRDALRFSGRLSFILFVIPFVASSLLRLRPSSVTRRLMKHRAEFGLAFVGSHVAHLGLIVWLGTQPEVTFAPSVIAFGGFGFVVLAALGATSFPATTRALGPRRWRMLHRFGVHYIAVIFAYDWINGLTAAPLLYAPFALLLVLVLALRFALRRPLAHGAR